MSGSNSLEPTEAKPETPPVLKKSKTISTKNDAAQTPTHFPGPLFPAVRRLSPTTSFNSATTSTTTTTTTNNDSFAFNFSDRDYIFPSNLGPYSARRNISIKSNSSKNQLSLSSQVPVRSASMPSSLSSAGGGGDSKNKPKLRIEKDLKNLSIQASNTASSLASLSSSSALACRNSSTFEKASKIGKFWKLYLVSIFRCSACSFGINHGGKFSVQHSVGSIPIISCHLVAS